MDSDKWVNLNKVTELVWNEFKALVVSRPRLSIKKSLCVIVDVEC